MAFNIHIILEYYREWFGRIIKHDAPSIVASFKDLCQIFSDLQLAQLDRMYESCLSEYIDAKTLVASPGLSLILDQIAVLQQVYETSLGPSNGEELFKSIQQLTVELMLRVLALHQNTLEDIEVELLRLNCLAALTLSCDIPEMLIPIREHAHDAVVHLLIRRLLVKAQLPESIDIDCPVPADMALTCVKNLSQTFVIHSGWDAAREEPRLLSNSDKQIVAGRAIDSIARFYQKAFEKLDAEQQADSLVKSPETIRLMLSASGANST